MNQGTTKPGLIQGLYRKLSSIRPAPAGPDGRFTHPTPAPDAVSLLEEVQAGGRPDYCLYIGPTRAMSAGPDVEGLLVRGFAPLPMVPIDGYKSPLRRLPTEGRLAEEAFAALSGHARVLLVVPSDAPQTVARVRWLSLQEHLWRAIFLMPDAGAFGIEDWPTAWEAAQKSIAPVGLELPPYTGGGWLFRYAIESSAPPRAATFRMIVHPNPEKIAKALEAICQEMAPDT